MLPANYVIQKFYQLTNSPKHNKLSNTYYAGCPICHEGKSWGKKRRLYYVVDDNLLYCQNCQRGWGPLDWLVEVTGESRDQILQDVENYEPNIRSIIEESERKTKAEKTKSATLPEDSVNLMDPVQVDYYSTNKVVQRALEFIKERRLDTAKYKAKTFWLSLKDKSHRNRLCIPFYDLSSQIIFYQTRALFEGDDPPKYKSKIGADKSLHNVEKIDPEHGKIYKIEGPIDSMFVRNGVGMCGLTITEIQRKQLHNYPFHEQIWVLDNDIKTEEVYEKYVKIIERGEKIFLWPKIFTQKDINEVCIQYKLDEFPHRVIDQNTFQGREALLRLASLRI